MKKILTITAAAFAAIGFSGCIEETLPTETVLSTQIGQSASALDGMVNSIYTNMVNYSNSDGGIETVSYGSLLSMFEHGTTMMNCPGYNGFNTNAAWHRGQVDAANRGKYPTYVYYGYIKNVNDIIGMIDTETANEQMLRYLGIAYAYRALYYMDIVRVMEYKTPTDSRYTFVQPKNDLKNLGVPIVTEKTSNAEAANNPRATVDEVYDLVLSDLANAEKYLDGYVRSDKIQPNVAVVKGLYARAYTELASRTETSATYKDKAAYWQQAKAYAEEAIALSGCSLLTEDQWTDPTTGFNNRNSQNSWMLATHIDPNNTDATTGGSFVFAMLMGTETTFSSYGWRVGRGLDRACYERLSNNDWRKKSWLGPEFFYLSANQKPGQEYLVEKSFANNKWALAGNNGSNEQSEWSDEIEGDYRLSSSASWVRSRINTSMGFKPWPWLYVNVKFRPAQGNYYEYEKGGATDFPIMRVEEMYFIKAEAELNLSGVATAKNTLVSLISTRNPNYAAECTAATKVALYEELLFQKGIEFWGEGINYFDAKRLELGTHRYYPGCSVERANFAIDMDRVHCGWTPQFNTAETNGNQAITDYDNPYTVYTSYTTGIHTNDELVADYGKKLDIEGHKFFDTDKLN
ncbi:MAG: RagB/SusD family nutrient uptake outer membrane protein [Bacteroidales bacterium]|nr:RagB/SusD family nutrient uptake outer membrane protein [Bacteroidales bacterium]